MNIFPQSPTHLFRIYTKKKCNFIKTFFNFSSWCFLNHHFQLERLRFLKNLRSLNLKGNEIERNDKHFRLYIAGLLHDLTYYEYKYISKLERENGRDRFRFRLREIVDNEKVEVQQREQSKRSKADNVHHMACFVEHLDDHQLFNSLFVFSNEEQGECLLKIGDEAQTLIAE